MTSNQMTEIQLLYCIATAGFFTLTIDGKTSVNLAHDASLGHLSSALQDIAGNVNLMYANPGLDSTLCDATGVIVSIEFLDRYGRCVSTLFL